MPELTPKLGIKKPLGNETVSRAAFNENWDIIDQNTVADKGGTPSIQAGLDADKPAAGTAGRLYVATDTQIIYRDTGTTWAKVGVVKWGDVDGKPSSFPPSNHKSTHATGGNDELTPADIGAETPSGAQAKADAAEANAKNYADTQIADLAGFVGYTDDDIVGVEVDFKNRKFTRLAGAVNRTPGAGFDDIKAFGGRKRCILTDDGKVLAYYGEPGYSETGKTTVEIKKNSVTYPVGTIVQVMVEQPKFYYKVVPLELEKIPDTVAGGKSKGYHMRKARYYISDTPKVGFKVHPAFVRNGVEVDKIYLSAYEGSIYDESAVTYLLADEQVADFNADKLSSVAYAKPASGLTQNLTRANTRKLANNRGIGWEQAFAATVALTQLLFTVEYASMNPQTAIGRGNVDKPSGDANISYTEITGATTHLGNQSGSVTNENGINIVTYRGEENFWGNIWKWVDGLNIFNSDLYVANHGFADDTNQEPYKDAGITLSKTSGYISAFGYNEEFDWLFFPSETKGDSALPVGDNFYQTTTLNTWRVARLGGNWDIGSAAGGFCWHVYSASSDRYRHVGGRLVYVPDAA